MEMVEKYGKFKVDTPYYVPSVPAEGKVIFKNYTLNKSVYHCPVAEGLKSYLAGHTITEGYDWTKENAKKCSIT